MSKRARQINQERFEEQVIEESEELELDVLDELPDIKPEDYVEKEKVTTKAMDEFLEGKVNWRVLDDTEED
jgi:DNA-directed RNA polymerase subunit K/omega